MRRPFVCVLAVLALAVAVPLLAQTEATVSGKVVSSTASQLVIQTDDGRQMTFNVDAQSTVPPVIASGNRVTVRYHDMSGSYHAANVEVTSAGAAAATDARRAMPEQTSAYPERPATTGTTRTGTVERTETTQSQTYTTETGTAEPRRTRRMPGTASGLPLVGLVGLLSLSAGLGLRALRQRA